MYSVAELVKGSLHNVGASHAEFSSSEPQVILDVSDLLPPRNYSCYIAILVAPDPLICLQDKSLVPGLSQGCLHVFEMLARMEFQTKKVVDVVGVAKTEVGFQCGLEILPH